MAAASFANDSGQGITKSSMSVGLQGDQRTGGLLRAGADLNLSTTGVFTNSVALHAGRNLSIDALHIDNQAGGELVSSAVTQLRAGGRVVNRGLIDGSDTRITAGELDNVGPARIYGDRVAVQAAVLNNRAENDIGPAATIAARERLDLGVQDLSNSPGALIYSAGDMAVGGALDGEWHAAFAARGIRNDGGTIEADRNLVLRAAEVRNGNAGFETAVRVVEGPVLLNEYQHDIGGDIVVSDNVTRFRQDQVVSIEDCQSLCLTTPAGVSDQWIRYAFTRTVHQTVVTRTSPGQILSGADLFIEADTLINDRSRIVAGGALTTKTTQPVINEGGAGIRTVMDEGKRIAVRRDWRNRRDSWYEVITPYVELQSFSIKNLGAARLEGHSTFSSTSPRPSGTAPLSAQATASSVTSVGVRTAGAPSDIVEVRTTPVAQVVALTPSAQAGTAPGVAAIPTQGTPVQFAQAGTVAAAGVSETGAAAPQPVRLTAAQAPKGIEKASAGAAVAHPVPLPDAPQLRIAAAQVATPAIVRTLARPASLPTSSLYRQHPEPGAAYLVETDPQFTQHRTWQGSDYMLGALQLSNTGKRLGDAFYEQKLVREQVLALTGQRFLADYTNDDAQYVALMNSGLTFARTHELRPGIALTPEQMALMTSDIVWLVTQEVTLSDGSVHSVLVPQVYVLVRDGDVDGTGALLAGREVHMDVSGDVVNSGTVAGRDLVRIQADNIRNSGGTIDASAVALSAAQDIDNIGGTLSAERLLQLNAGRDLKVATTTSSSASATSSRTGIDRVASLHVRGDAGVLLASAGRDIDVTTASVTSAGGASLQAGRDLKLGTVTTSRSDSA